MKLLATTAFFTVTLAMNALAQPAEARILQCLYEALDADPRFVNGVHHSRAYPEISGDFWPTAESFWTRVTIREDNGLLTATDVDGDFVPDFVEDAVGTRIPWENVGKEWLVKFAVAADLVALDFISVHPEFFPIKPMSCPDLTA